MRKKSSILFLLRIAKMIIGIINLSLTAKFFGVSLNKDVWILAITLTLFLDAIFWGPINETYRTKFIFLKNDHGELEALEKTKSLIFFTFLISILIVGFVEFFPGIIAKMAAPSYNVTQMSTLVHMIRLTGPILLINQLALLGVSILNSYNSFFIPEISAFITSIINLILIIVLAPFIGIYSLLIAYYIGIIILLIMILYQIKKNQIAILSNYSNIRFKDFLLFFVYALPFFLPYFFGQISAVFEKTLASTLGVGNVSTVDYSRKFTDMLNGVLTSVFITLLVPILSEAFVKNRKDEFVLNFLQIYRLGLLFLTFTLSLFSVCSDDIVNLFYNKGNITQQNLSEIGILTMFYSWSSLSVFFYSIFGIALLSTGKNKIYALLGVFAQVLSILLNYLFIDKIGMFIFPISFFISHLISGIVMFFRFPFSTKILWIETIKYLLIMILVLVLVYLTKYFHVFFENSVLNIAFISIYTLILMVFTLFLFNLEEKNIIKELVKKLKII